MDGHSVSYNLSVQKREIILLFCIVNLQVYIPCKRKIIIDEQYLDFPVT